MFFEKFHDGRRRGPFQLHHNGEEDQEGEEDLQEEGGGPRRGHSGPEEWNSGVCVGILRIAGGCATYTTPRNDVEVETFLEKWRSGSVRGPKSNTNRPSFPLYP